MTLLPISRLGVREHWPRIIHHIRDLHAQRKSAWMPEDVYTELVGGRVTLYLMQKDGISKGFFVARANADYDGMVLFIWIMWTEPYAFTNGEGFPPLEELARSIGAKRIRHESHHKGWIHKGFELKSYIYEREVSNVHPDTTELVPANPT